MAAYIQPTLYLADCFFFFLQTLMNTIDIDDAAKIALYIQFVLYVEFFIECELCECDRERREEKWMCFFLLSFRPSFCAYSVCICNDVSNRLCRWTRKNSIKLILSKPIDFHKFSPCNKHSALSSIHLSSCVCISRYI